MIKRLAVTLLIVMGLIFPITKAFAVLPLVYLAYAAVAGAELTPWIAGSTTLVGATIAILNFKKQATATATSPAIQITLDPNTPLITPPNWTAPATGTQEPTPPQTGGGTFHSQTFGLSAPTGEQLAILYDNARQAANPPTAQRYFTHTFDAAQFAIKIGDHFYDPADQQMHVIYEYEAVELTCEPGYNNENDYKKCELATPQAVQKPADHLCEMVKSGTGTFTPSPNDPDCANATIAGKSTAKLEYTVSETEHLIIQNDNNGKVTITQKAYNASENKTSAYTATLSAARVVTATTTTNATGNTLSDTGTGTGTGGTSGETTVVNFPNDYAKSGEAQAAANSTNGKLDTLHNDLTGTANPADGSATTPEFSNGMGNTFEALQGWSVPAHTSTCPTGSFTAFNTTFTLNSQCTIMEQVKTPLTLAATVGWVILALFIVLAA